MPKLIFISYRRTDNTFAGRIRDRLVTTFGESQVFKDSYNIGQGDDFPDKIKAALNQCDVMLVLISPTWLSATEKNKNGVDMRRLDNPDDWVRREIAFALDRGNVRIIPILVQRANMPSVIDLPEALCALADKNAVEIRDDPYFDRDIGEVISGLRSRRFRMYFVYAIVVLFLVIGMAVFYALQNFYLTQTENGSGSVTPTSKEHLAVLGRVQGGSVVCGSILEAEFTAEYQEILFTLALKAGDSVEVLLVPFGNQLLITQLKTAIIINGPTNQFVGVSQGELFNYDGLNLEIVQKPFVESNIVSASGEYKIRVINFAFSDGYNIYTDKYSEPSEVGGVGVFTLYINCTLRDGTVITAYTFPPTLTDTLLPPTVTNTPQSQPTTTVTINYQLDETATQIMLQRTADAKAATNAALFAESTNIAETANAVPITQVTATLRYLCEGIITSDSGAQIIEAIYSLPSITSRRLIPLDVGKAVYVSEENITGRQKWFHIMNESGSEIGWIQDVYLPTCR